MTSLMPVQDVDESEDTVPALLFIPDISGFTRFVNSVKIKHSHNLIADLLEIIIEANVLGMELCEIQGDAVLFYKVGDPPPVEDIVNQCKQIFLDFQNHLRIVESTSSALGTTLSDTNLTLKIVVHYGRVAITQIREHTKLMGKDVIIAHRLLKNDIHGEEYVLLSEQYLQTQDEKKLRSCFAWTQLQNGASAYEYLGEVRYKFAFLTPLRLLITTIKPFEYKKNYPNAISARTKIEAPARFVLRIIRNLRLKPAWMVGMSAVHYDTTKADRTNPNYKCDLNRGQIDLQAVQTDESPERIVYIEKVANFRIYPNSMLFYYLRENEDQHTILTIEFHYSRVSVGRRFGSFFGKRRMRIFLGKSILQLKELCERLCVRKVQ
jgi:hypothetical protein